jgi:hypothetical protein
VGFHALNQLNNARPAIEKLDVVLADPQVTACQIDAAYTHEIARGAMN